VKPAGGVRQVLLRDATWYPFGPVAQWTYGNGRLMRRSLNQNYHPGFVEDHLAGGISLGYEFDAVGNLAKLRPADQTDPPERLFGYDALNRLDTVHDGAGALLQDYDYDKTGNRTRLVSGAAVDYTYPTTSHRLSNVDGVARTYDAAGNTTAIGGAARQFVYDAANRMSQAKASGAVTMNYRYNGKGEQVRRFLGTANTYIVYDEAGRWLGDYDTAGAPIQQAVWLDDLPVGVLVGSGASQKLNYVQPDALGTPRVVIDPTRGASGTAIWEWDLAGEAFGNSVPDQDVDGDGVAFVFDMRFPGQRYDAASGLNYNYFRDYESGTGRYAQSDPIGLHGGIATYPYVNSKPLKLIDSLGLLSLKSPTGYLDTVGCLGEEMTVFFDSGIIQSKNCPDITRCARVHELRHLRDAVAWNQGLNVCDKNRGKKYLHVSPTQKIETECNAHLAESSCLDAAYRRMKSQCDNGRCYQEVVNRLDSIYSRFIPQYCGIKLIVPW
jgi:RHS repeat-associated protein